MNSTELLMRLTMYITQNGTTNNSAEPRTMVELLFVCTLMKICPTTMMFQFEPYCTWPAIMTFLPANSW